MGEDPADWSEPAPMHQGEQFKMPTPHIEEDLLDQYAMGTLPGESVAEVEEHLLLCSFCQRRLKETDEFLPIFRAAVTDVVPRPASGWRRLLALRNAIWAVGTAVVVAVVVFLIPGELPKNKVPPAILQMQSLRGPDASVQISASRPYLLVFDVAIQATSAGYEIEIVNAMGEEILKKVAEVKDGQLTALIDSLARGSYWVRVYRKRVERELVAEYGLRAE
jgi:hypothetical protein